MENLLKAATRWSIYLVLSGGAVDVIRHIRKNGTQNLKLELLSLGAFNRQLVGGASSDEVHK